MLLRMVLPKDFQSSLPYSLLLDIAIMDGGDMNTLLAVLLLRTSVLLVLLLFLTTISGVSRHASATALVMLELTLAPVQPHSQRRISLLCLLLWLVAAV
jgi:hypothetical protein